MKCSEFLDRYTDFHDGALAPEESDAFRGHMSGCAACRRYDEVVTQGVELLRALPETGPGEDFRARLRHSIHTMQEERRRRRLLGSSVRTMPLLGALAVFGALFVALALREEELVVDLPPIVAEAPSPTAREPLPLPLSSPLLPAPGRTPLAAPAGIRGGVGVLGVPSTPRRVIGASAPEPEWPLPVPELWRGANELLYRSSSLYLRYREPDFVRTTGLR